MGGGGAELVRNTILRIAGQKPAKSHNRFRVFEDIR